MLDGVFSRGRELFSARAFQKVTKQNLLHYQEQKSPFFLVRDAGSRMSDRFSRAIHPLVATQHDWMKYGCSNVRSQFKGPCRILNYENNSLLHAADVSIE
jgi:hypothetical protein